MEELAKLARMVTHPYQLMVPSSVQDHNFIIKAFSLFTGINPHTPVELIFFDPYQIPDINRLLNESHIDRPHYLDGHLRPLYQRPGNRAILFTVVSSSTNSIFFGPMQRHVYWWKNTFMPDKQMINDLEEHGFNGILVDSVIDAHHIHDWQDKMVDHAGDFIHITFSRLNLNRRWLIKTMPDEFCPDILPII